MSTNKHAAIRYKALDRCFSNRGRRYYIGDLVEACNEAIYEYTGVAEGVKKRQVQEDIRFLESEQGGAILLERCRDGHRIYYRYKDPHFSIENRPLNQVEAEQLQETIGMLSRFKGMSHFDWMDELFVRLENTFHLKGDRQNVVGFEQNPYLKGLNFFTELFYAIVNRQVLRIGYKSFHSEKRDYILHPYYLKQYNNRWFLFGLNHALGKITNLALDRILTVEPVDLPYIRNLQIDFEAYFEDVVGVTVLEAPVEKIVLQVTPDLVGYIENKPIHGSQKLHLCEDGSARVELELIVNYEFKTLLLGYADRVRVVEPESLRKQITERARQILDRNV